MIHRDRSGTVTCSHRTTQTLCWRKDLFDRSRQCWPRICTISISPLPSCSRTKRHTSFVSDCHRCKWLVVTSRSGQQWPLVDLLGCLAVPTILTATIRLGTRILLSLQAGPFGRRDFRRKENLHARPVPGIPSLAVYVQSVSRQTAKSCPVGRTDSRLAGSSGGDASHTLHLGI